MDEGLLAELTAPYDLFDRMLSVAGLHPAGVEEPYYDEMLLRIDEDRLETPAGSTTSSLATYCSASASMLDGFALHRDEPVTALFDIGEVQDWLAWVDDGGPVTVRVFGDPETGNAGELALSAGGLEAHVDCYRDPEMLAEVTLELPNRFTDEERFILEDGELAPTVVETRAEELARIADGVELDRATTTYPFVVRDSALRVELGDTRYTRATGTLDGAVTGPDVRNEYDRGFSLVFDTVRGPVTVQTGPDEPLVVVSDREAFTLRYVLLPIVW